MKSPVFELSIKGMHSLLIPEEIARMFTEAGHSRVKVIAQFEGKILEFHAALKQYQGNYVMTFGKRYQKELGIYPNDYFQMQLFEDTSKYGVEVPEELEAVLESDPDAKQIFESFTPGKIRSIIYAISRYKNAQTRIDKSLILADNIKRGIRDQREFFKPL